MTNTTYINGTCYRFEDYVQGATVEDMVTCIIVLCAIGINLVGGVLVLVARKYPPVLAKQPFIVFTSIFGLLPSSFASCILFSLL